MKFEKMIRLIEIVSYARGFCEEATKEKEVALMLEDATDILMEEIQEVINTQKRSVDVEASDRWNNWKNEGGYFGTVKEEVIPDGFSKGDYCLNCSNHPSNGGSGICHCTLGSPMIY